MEEAWGIRWHIVGFAAGGAFVLSFLLGILSGKPFVSIFLTAFLFGAVFAVLSIGSFLIIKRFIPHLFTDAGSPASENAGPRPSSVNIVLEEGDETKDDVIEELSLDDTDQDGSAATERETRRSPLEKDADSAAANQTEEEKSFVSAAVPVDEDSFADEEFVVEEGLKEADKPIAEKRSAPAAPPPSGKASVMEENDLDVLPDMSTFESSFSPVTSGGMVTGTESFDHFDTDSLRRSDAEKDPETYVKAVRTVLKRDEGKKS